jgi:hypothetical protein
MKLKLIILFVCFSLIANSATYYVQDTAYNANASDENTGTDISLPWATWQHAFETADAGDTVYFRSGIWYPSEHSYGNSVVYIHTTYYSPSSGIGHTGTAENPICFFAYPGETPILDCINVDTTGNTSNSGIDLNNTGYLYFKGLTLRNVLQPLNGSVASGFGAGWYPHNMTFENCIAYNIGGRGFAYSGTCGFNGIETDTTRFINCDAYNCNDSLSVVPGNGADGWKCDSEAGGYLEWIGCRAWNCTDDGFDISGSGDFLFKDCWSFLHGFIGARDGTGFKFGAARGDSAYIDGEGVLHLGDSIGYDRILRNNIAAFNTGAGFGQSDYDPYYKDGSLLYNNTAYRNTGNFSASSNDCLYPMSVYRNNISYEPLGFDAAMRPYYAVFWQAYTESNNTFDSCDIGSVPKSCLSLDFTVTDDDFILTDSVQGVAQMTASRKAGGALPDITFLKLKEGSDLIDGGIQIPESDSSGVVLTFFGSAPDLGYSEYGFLDTTDNNILTFIFTQQTGTATIDTANHTVSIEVEYGTSVTALQPTITVSEGATISPTSGTATDFTSPVVYTVTALDESTQEWTVTVTEASNPNPPPPGRIGFGVDSIINQGTDIRIQLN